MTVKNFRHMFDELSQTSGRPLFENVINNFSCNYTVPEFINEFEYKMVRLNRLLYYG